VITNLSFVEYIKYNHGLSKVNGFFHLNCLFWSAPLNRIRFTFYLFLIGRKGGEKDQKRQKDN
jgi:hypothetical protein